MSGFIEKVVGEIGETKRWRECNRPTSVLPVGYGEEADALERYLMYRGAITKGDTLVSMLEEFADPFERAATDGTSICEVVGRARDRHRRAGDDRVRFAGGFLVEYSEGEWIDKESKRLVDVFVRAEAEKGSGRS